jgi:hypothetical protein
MRFVIASTRIPWTLWAYSALVVLSGVLVEIQASAPSPAKLLLAAFLLGWLYLLLRGMWWVWGMTVAIYILELAAEVAAGSITWQGVGVRLVGLLLLLLPASRAYSLTRPPAN